MRSYLEGVEKLPSGLLEAALSCSPSLPLFLSATHQPKKHSLGNPQPHFPMIQRGVTDAKG
ncbi:mCG1030696 [Mus musculus]|nr:mCG1030696 [Mus musculus]